VAVRGDPGGVPPGSFAPDHTTVGHAQCVRLLVDRREEDEVSDDQRRAENVIAPVKLPQLPTCGRVVSVKRAVVVAYEDPTVRERRRRVAPSGDRLCPQHVPIRGSERNHLARAGDREQPLPIGRRACVEAVVAQEVALDGAIPKLVAVQTVEAEDPSSIGCNADPVSPDRGAGVDDRARIEGRRTRPLRRTTSNSLPSWDPK
jgi:hypothetical protein